MRPLRVLHVVPTLTGGGAENFVASLAPLLNDDSMECSVMTIYPSEMPANARQLSATPIFPIERTGRYDPGFLPRMLAVLRRIKPDVVHTHMHNGKYWGRVAALLARVPAVAHTVHNPCDPFRTRGESIADRVLNAASAAIITFSKEQRRTLARLEGVAEEKIVVIPNGIVHREMYSAETRATVRRSFGLDDQEYAIFVVGRLQEQKNQKLAIEAMRWLPPALRSRFRLYIVGNGEDRHMLTQMLESYGLERRIGMLGYRPDVADILPAADLVFMPSLTEGMPLALLEAMSVAIPVLSTPWIGAHEMLESGRLGRITADWDPENVSKAFVSAYLDREVMQSTALISQALVRAEYDIAVTAERHRRLYRELMLRCRAA